MPWMSSPSAAPAASTGADTGPTAPVGGFLARAAESRKRKQLAAWVKDQFEESRSARHRIERQWYLNIQFYRGRQNVEFRRSATSTAGYRLAVPPAPPWRVRAIINRIRPMARKEMAKLTSQKPSFVVAPATADDDDQAAARVGEQLLETRYSDLGIAGTQRQWVWWAVVCGTSFLKERWDPGAGPKDPRTKEPLGDSVVEAVDPFHLFVPDLHEPELDKQPWIIHAATHPAEYVKRYYKVDAPGKSTQSVDLFADDLLAGGAPKPKDRVLVLECWLRPGTHPDFPTGGVVTVVGDEVAVATQGSPFLHGEQPFIKLDVIPTGGFYAESSITDLIPLQRLYNRQRSQLIETANTMGRPKWIAPVGSVNGSQIDSEPGQVITYQPIGPAPTPVPMPPVPSYFQEMPQAALRDMDDISGQHEISRGQQPGQVTAATAISYLQEQDDTLLAWAVGSLEDGMARLGRHLLSHVVQFWGAPRLVRVVGEDQSFDAVELTGSALRGNTDVRVQAGSALPTSRAARQATVLELFKLGAFGAPGSPEATAQLLEALDLSGMEQALADWRIDQREATRENTMMAQGRPCQVQPWQNHEAHIATHNRFRKGQRFLALPPEVHAMFAEHVQAHEEANMQQQMVAQLAGGGMMPPGAPGAPGGGAPGEGPADPSGGEGPGAPAGPGGLDPGTLAPADLGGSPGSEG